MFLIRKKKLLLLLGSAIIILALICIFNFVNNLQFTILSNMHPVIDSIVDENFKFTKEYTSDNLYDLYVIDNSDELALVQIKSIEKDNIDYSVIRNIYSKDNSSSFTQITNDSENTYVLNTNIESPEIDISTNCLIFNNSKEISTIPLKNINGSEPILCDEINNKLYIVGNNSSKKQKELFIIDTDSREVVKIIDLVGYIRNYSINDNEVILNFEKADKDILVIDRETLSYDKLDRDKYPENIVGVSGTEDNRLLFSNNNSTCEILSLNENNEIKTLESLDAKIENLYTGNKNLSYLTFSNNSIDSSSFSIFDSNTSKIVKTFDISNTIINIKEVDNNLFVLTKNGHVYIYNTDNYEEIGNIFIGKKNINNFAAIKVNH